MVRTQRVVVMLTPAEMAKLEGLADERELPLGTLAYEALAKWLRRQGVTTPSRSTR